MIQGDVAAYFESGNHPRSVETISYNASDPGGKSYGKYQLSVRSGTLKKYIAWSRFNDKFKYANPGSKEFDKIWVTVAQEEPEFEKDQHEFIELTHFKPVQRYAKLQGFDTDNFAVNEALFSIGVQHGGYKNIIDLAVRQRACAKPSVKEDIENLYKARDIYVGKIGLPKNIENALHNRYKKELAMVTALYTNLMNEKLEGNQYLAYIAEVSLDKFV